MRTISSPTDPKRGADTETRKISGDPRQILLIEFINLLGLFLKHARHAQGARATAVMFGQIVQRLQTIEKIPGHDGAMILRRVKDRSHRYPDRPDYHIIFADMAFSGAHPFMRNGKIEKNTRHLYNALEQTFGSFAEMGISALYIQLTGNSPERIDQLRLAFNIIARYHHAVENNASITFRYFGRAMTVPLIKDRRGKPDPNLTLVAGLNGLSAINMREIMKQAEAFGQLSGNDSSEIEMYSNFNQLFRVRSLRSQLTRPLVEVNNLPWMDIESVGEGDLSLGDQMYVDESVGAADDKRAFDEESIICGEKERIDANQTSSEETSPPYLSVYMDSSDPKLAKAIETVFGSSVAEFGSRDIGEYLGAATVLLYAIEADRVDDDSFNKVMAFLYNQLDRLPERLLDQLVPQRQGLKIEEEGNTFLVGMIHTKLLDLIRLIKGRLLTQRKISSLKYLDAGTVLENDSPIFKWLGVDEEEIKHVIRVANISLNRNDQTNQSGLNTEMDALGPLKNTLFELLWCILRHQSKADETILLLDALKLLSMRLEDPCGAIGFLMTDLFQIPETEINRNRNAFVLINSMLLKGGGGGIQYTDRTPGEVLSSRKGLDPSTVRYVKNRLGACRYCAVTKFKSIREQLLKSQEGPERSKAFSLLKFQLLLALEREGFIFLALAGGKTGREVIREAIQFYGDIQNILYKTAFRDYLPDLMGHIEILLRAIALIGSRKDMAALKLIEQTTAQWMALDSDPGHIRSVQRMLKWVADAIRNIQVQDQ